MYRHITGRCNVQLKNINQSNPGTQEAAAAPDLAWHAQARPRGEASRPRGEPGASAGPHPEVGGRRRAQAGTSFGFPAQQGEREPLSASGLWPPQDGTLRHRLRHQQQPARPDSAVSQVQGALPGLRDCVRTPQDRRRHRPGVSALSDPAPGVQGPGAHDGRCWSAAGHHLHQPDLRHVVQALPADRPGGSRLCHQRLERLSVPRLLVDEQQQDGSHQWRADRQWLSAARHLWQVQTALQAVRGPGPWQGLGLRKLVTVEQQLPEASWVNTTKELGRAAIEHGGFVHQEEQDPSVAIRQRWGPFFYTRKPS